MSSKDFLAWRLEAGALSEVPERVVEEGPLSVRVNGKPFTVTLRTPGDDRALVLGLLFSEGLVESREDLLALYEEPAGGLTDRSAGLEAPPRAPVASVRGSANWSASIKRRPALEAKLGNRSLASTSSCGFCGKTEWVEGGDSACISRDSRDAMKISSGSLEGCFRAMRERQDLFGKTGGSHAAAVFSADGSLRAFGEDAGRHNAVDKCVGFLWEKGRLAEGAIQCVSGRVSYEIAAKAARAGFRVLAAVSAPSSMAVESCRENGITLIGFCRGPRATVYAHPERVVSGKSAMEKA